MDIKTFLDSVPCVVRLGTEEVVSLVQAGRLDWCSVIEELRAFAAFQSS